MVYTDTSTHPNGLYIKPLMLNKVLLNHFIYYLLVVLPLRDCAVFVFSRVLRDSIGHYVGRLVGPSVCLSVRPSVV